MVNSETLPSNFLLVKKSASDQASDKGTKSKTNKKCAVENKVFLIKSPMTKATPPSQGPRKYPIKVVPIKPSPNLTRLSEPNEILLKTVCKAMSIAAKVTVRVVSFGLLQDKWLDHW